MIFVECNPDLALVKSLVSAPRREIVHAGSKGNVCNQLKKRNNCKGMIDEDPWAIQPPYVERAKLVNDFPNHGLKLLHGGPKDNYLVVICPRLEEWILAAAEEAHVDLNRLGLPGNPERLHSEINVNLDRFERLLADLRQKRPARLMALRDLLGKA